MDAAMEASPGRVTVHIWSSVRSVKDYGQSSAKRFAEEHKTVCIRLQERRCRCNSSIPAGRPWPCLSLSLWMMQRPMRPPVRHVA